MVGGQPWGAKSARPILKIKLKQKGMGAWLK
jgi:hypothetical protein